MPRSALLLLLLAFAACASHPRTGPNLAATHAYSGLTCAPFARALTGLALSGDAADWWRQASGRYARANTPAVGVVLVFRRGPHLPSGHVSVVSRVLDARRIHVIQANWVRDELDEDQLIVDVSPHNDWTEVRVWYPPADQLGSHTYATYGFIVPPAPLGHDALASRAEPAARSVTGG
jgi:surface antigen